VQREITKQPVQSTGIRFGLLANHYAFQYSAELTSVHRYDLDVRLLPRHAERSEDGQLSTNDVARVSGAKRRQVVRLLMEELERTNKDIAMATNYNKHIIAAKKIQHEYVPGTMQIDYLDELESAPPPHDCEVFEVRITYFGELSFNSLIDHFNKGHPAFDSADYHDKEATIEALNIIFSYRPLKLSLRSPTRPTPALTTANGQKVYGVAQGPMPIETGRPFNSNNRSGGLDSIPGFYRSVHQTATEDGQIRQCLSLNLNTMTGLFYPPTGTLQQLINTWIASHASYGSWTISRNRDLGMFLRGLRVRTNHLGPHQNEYRSITGIGKPNTNENPKPTVWSCSMQTDGTQVNTSVADYFNQNTPSNFADRSEVLVVVSGDGREHTTWPASCLDIVPGQMFIDPEVKPAGAIRTPTVNKNMIRDPGKKTFFGVHAQEEGARKFRLEMDPALLQVTGVKMSNPDLKYRQAVAGGTGQIPRAVDTRALESGSWNLHGRAFYRPTIKRNWIYYELSLPNAFCSDSDLDAFRYGMANAFQTYGMTNFNYIGQPAAPRRVSLPDGCIPGRFDQGKLQILETQIEGLFRRAKSAGAHLIILLLPRRTDVLYAIIKRVGDQTVGIRTMCIQTAPPANKRGPNKPKSSFDFYGNLCQKANLKLWNPRTDQQPAVNQILDQKAVLDNKTVVLGIDVGHPGSMALHGAPSVAAVVGNVDDQFAQWPASLRTNPVDPLERQPRRFKEKRNPQQSMTNTQTRMQGSQKPGIAPGEAKVRGTKIEQKIPAKDDEDAIKAAAKAKEGQEKKHAKEMVAELEDMAYERLLAWSDMHGGLLPEKVIVYRDGLSEGQFSICLRDELPKIQAALKRLTDERGPGTEPGATLPKIMLICAVKRHHTRFFPLDKNPDDKSQIGHDRSGYNENPRPGTCVHERVTYGRGDDFFLISQAAIQGTARPIHYVVLFNETSHPTSEIAHMVSPLSSLGGPLFHY
jgi:hypothetical protein